MFEIGIIIIALVSIGWYARLRGGSPLIWPLVAAGGYIFFLKLGPKLFPIPEGESFNLPRFLLMWGWVVAVFLFVRFGLGRRKVKPGGKWVCPKCAFLNSELAVVCEMCDEPYTEPQEKQE
jgi:hypothetical protein